MTANINLFRRICRQRISSRQIDNTEVITFKVEITFFGIHSHTAIISYMLMSTGSQIKQRSLAAVRISDQGNIDGAAFT